METTKKPEVGDALKLTNREVLAEMTIDPTERQYKGSRAGQTYFIGSCKGVGFTASDELYEAWKDGQVAEVNLTFKTYEREVDDIKNPGQKTMQTREGWTVTGFTTYAQLKGITKNIGEIALIEKELDLDYRIKFATKLKDMQLTDGMLELLKTAV